MEVTHAVTVTEAGRRRLRRGAVRSSRARYNPLAPPRCWTTWARSTVTITYASLIANQRPQRLDHVTATVVGLGHEVIARSVDVAGVAAITARERPDVALVGLGESSQHALDLIDQIVRGATCPVIALLETDDHRFINEAAKRGIFAYITDADPDDLQSSIGIVLRRFAEYHNLEGAFGRRAVIERAKGILMERHSVDETHAFELLRSHARSSNRKLTDIASAVVDGHRLLPGPSNPS